MLNPAGQLNLRQRGFTLLECLITLLLIGVILAFVVPPWQKTLKKRQAVVMMQELRQFIEWAKVRAVLSGSSVIICPSHNSSECGKEWSKGLLAFDARKDQPIRYLKVQPKQAVLQWRGFYHPHLLKIHPSGLSRTLNGQFYYYPSGELNQVPYRMVLNRMGKIRLELDLH